MFNTTGPHRDFRAGFAARILYEAGGDPTPESPYADNPIVLAIAKAGATVAREFRGRYLSSLAEHDAMRAALAAVLTAPEGSDVKAIALESARSSYAATFERVRAERERSDRERWEARRAWLERCRNGG